MPTQAMETDGPPTQESPCREMAEAETSNPEAFLSASRGAVLRACLMAGLLALASLCVLFL